MTKTNATSESIQKFMCEKVAAIAGITVAHVDPKAPLARYGLDSARAIQLVDELSTFVGAEVDPALMWDYPNVAEFADAVVRDLQAGGR